MAGIAFYPITATDEVARGIEVAAKEVGGDAHAAVNEEKPRMSGGLDEAVADGGTTDVVPELYVHGMGQGA